MPGARVARAVPIAYAGGIASRSERYMRDHWAAAKGFLPPEALLESARREEADHVKAQQDAGLDVLSPALVRWEDLLRPLAPEPGQLTRYFETNTFFRQPLVDGPLPPADPVKWFEAFAIPAGRPWCLTLPSPWDFAVRAKGDVSPREVGEALRPVVAAAARQGAAVLRFHDPSIVYARAARRDVAAFAEGLAAAARGHEAISTLHLTNGDPFAHPDVLQANPLGGLSIEDPGRAPPAGLRLPNKTKLAVAVVRGEESLVEDPKSAAESASALAGRLGLPLHAVTNGWDLDHVPHGIAVRKLQALGETKRVLAEVLA